MRIAPVVPQLLPKSIASPALIAYMIVSKFCDALPFYRQERRFQRMGMDISRQDMSNWTLKVFDRVKRLPDTQDPQNYQSLLPWNIKKESLLDFDSARLY